MSFGSPSTPSVSVPKAKDPLPPVVSRADEAAGISQAKQRSGALSTFLARGGKSETSRPGLSGTFGDMFKKLLGE